MNKLGGSTMYYTYLDADQLFIDIIRPDKISLYSYFIRPDFIIIRPDKIS